MLNRWNPWFPPPPPSSCKSTSPTNVAKASVLLMNFKVHVQSYPQFTLFLFSLNAKTSLFKRAPKSWKMSFFFGALVDKSSPSFPLGDRETAFFSCLPHLIISTLIKILYVNILYCYINYSNHCSLKFTFLNWIPCWLLDKLLRIP